MRRLADALEGLFMIAAAPFLFVWYVLATIRKGKR